METFRLETSIKYVPKIRARIHRSAIPTPAVEIHTMREYVTLGPILVAVCTDSALVAQMGRILLVICAVETLALANAEA